jgi:heme exporter protein D
MDVLPLAHAGHWIWTLYVPPVAVVVFSIVKTTLSERRMAREEEKEKKEKGRGDDAGEESA